MCIYVFLSARLIAKRTLESQVSLITSVIYVLCMKSVPVHTKYINEQKINETERHFIV